MLLLTVANCGIGIGLPVVLLVVGMSLAPLPPAIADHLGVYGIIQALLASVLVTPSGLTLRSTADGLVGTAFGRLKGLLAIRAERGGKIISSEVCLDSNLKGNQICRCCADDVKSAIEYLPRPRQWVLFLIPGIDP